MKVGLFDEFDSYRRPAQDRYREVAALIRNADELGFDFFGTTESFSHHFWSPSAFPLGLFAQAAAGTRRLRFLTAVLVPPVHHPLKLAQEVALADQLLDGRLDLGVGRGHPPVHLRLGLSPADSRARFDEALGMLRRLLAGETVTARGRFWSLEAARVHPLPRQQPVPIILAATSLESAREAGRSALPVVIPAYTGIPVDVAAETAAAYRASLPPEGRADVTLGVLAHVDVDRRRAYRTAAPAVARVWGTFLELYGGPPPADRRAGVRLPHRLSAWETARDPAFVAGAFPAYPVAIGDPVEVTEKILQLVATVRPQGLILMASFGGVPPEAVSRSLRLLEAAVLPAVRGEGGR